MRVMLLHKLAEDIPEDYVPPQKLIADVGKMVSDARGVPACEIRSGIRFHERMIEAAGFFQMKGVGSSFQCAMNTPGSSVSHHLERRNACVMLWLGELRSLDQVVQSGAHCPTVITNSFPEITAAPMADILKRCNEDRHPPPSTGASRCC